MVKCVVNNAFVDLTYHYDISDITELDNMQYIVNISFI